MHQNEMNREFEEIRKLSLTARMIVCLINFEEFCLRKGLDSPEIFELVNYLWKWPSIEGPDEFDPWISSAPVLIDFALGDELSPDMVKDLNNKNIENQRFRNIVENLVEIVWSSFWGAAEDLQSYDAFKQSIISMEAIELPPITPFKFSRFEDNEGWGVKPTPEDCKYWRSLRSNA